MKIKSANGISGHLLQTVDGTYWFRVYRPDFTFTDYDLHHSDLCITINDPDAALYERDDGTTILDHSPETLGIE